jgi:hydroxymethylbilane synthase
VKRLRIATRGSDLALWQANFVASLLDVPCHLEIVSTQGDKDKSSALSTIGGQGVFVKEVQVAVLEGRADFAVHSAKDLPTASLDGLVIGAFPKRGDVRDVLVGLPLDKLPSGSLIATGSRRRQLQLAAMRHDLSYVPLRGNMAKRISMAKEYGAIVAAYAALERLNLLDSVAQVFEPDEVLPQVGQGALAIECRSDDIHTRSVLSQIDHLQTRMAVEAERSLLRQLGSGCMLPVAAYGWVDEGTSRVIKLRGLIGSIDGQRVIRVSGEDQDPETVGARLGQQLLELGGNEILKSIERDSNGL